MFANNLEYSINKITQFIPIIFLKLISILLLISATMGVNYGAVVSLDSSSVNIGGDDKLIYTIRCWQEGKEIISETNFVWSSQSLQTFMSQSLAFIDADEHKSQFVVIPIGTAVCRVYGRSKSR